MIGLQPSARVAIDSEGLSRAEAQARASFRRSQHRESIRRGNAAFIVQRSGRGAYRVLHISGLPDGADL